MAKVACEAGGGQFVMGSISSTSMCSTINWKGFNCAMILYSLAMDLIQ